MAGTALQNPAAVLLQQSTQGSTHPACGRPACHRPCVCKACWLLCHCDLPSWCRFALLCCRLPQAGPRVLGTSGEEVEVRQTPDLQQLKKDLQVGVTRGARDRQQGARQHQQGPASPLETGRSLAAWAGCIAALLSQIEAGCTQEPPADDACSAVGRAPPQGVLVC